MLHLPRGTEADIKARVRSPTETQPRSTIETPHSRSSFASASRDLIRYRARLSTGSEGVRAPIDPAPHSLPTAHNMGLQEKKV